MIMDEVVIDIYFDHSDNNYYAKEEFICESCNKKIEEIMRYLVNWGKQSSHIDTYCLNCWGKIKERPSMAEVSYSCIITNKIPEMAIPIFLQPPTLCNTNGLSTFQVADIMKNCDTEIDNTRLAGRTDHAAAVEVQKNKELLKQRDQELGESPFMLLDQRKQRKMEAMQKAEEILNNKKLEVYEKIEKIGEIKEELKINKKDIDVNYFFENIKNSTPLLPDFQEKKRLE